jgi:hypothetical protein
MGEVYKAKDTRLARTVAIKVKPQTLSDHPERRARFEREGRAVSAINHSHICTLYDLKLYLFSLPAVKKEDRTPEFGAYLSQALAHCCECRTPRTFMGATDRERYYAGSVERPEGELAPNITPDDETGIGEWSVRDIVWFLQTSFKPDGDDARGLMAETVEHGYRRLEESDPKAIALYLESLPPIRNEVKAKPAK